MSTESTVVRVKRDGQILLADNGAAHQYIVAYEPGDFAYDVPDYTIVHTLDRGVINGDGGSVPQIRIGNEQPMTGSFSAYLRDLGSASYATLLDVAHRYAAGYMAAWSSTMGSASDVFTITISLTIDGSPFGESDKTVSFPFCVFRAANKEGDPSMVDCKFTSYCVRPVLS